MFAEGVRPCVPASGARRSTATSGWRDPSGLDPAGLLAGVGLDIADLAVPDKWVPAAAVARLLERSAQQSGLEDFGLRLAGLRRLSTLGPLSVVLRQEPDLRSALRLLTPLRAQLQRGPAPAPGRVRRPGQHAAVVRVHRTRSDPAGIGAGDGGAGGHRPRAAGQQVGAAVGVLHPPPPRRRSPPTESSSGHACSSGTSSPASSSTPASSTRPTRRRTLCYGPTPKSSSRHSAPRAPRRSPTR